MEFCSKSQLIVSQLVSQLELNHSQHQHTALSESIRLVKCVSDCFFSIFKLANKRNGTVFCDLTPDSFWFYFSLLKISFGLAFDSSVEQQHYRNQVLSYFSALIDGQEHFHALVIRAVLLHHCPEAPYDRDQIFVQVLQLNKFIEFYNVCSDVMVQDFHSMFLCFHQLLNGALLLLINIYDSEDGGWDNL